MADCSTSVVVNGDTARRGFLAQLPSVLAVSIFSYLSYSSRNLGRYSYLCQSFRRRLSEDAVWRYLCRDFWYVTEDRFSAWPSLCSYRTLYTVLERWAALEGFYSLPIAFPWCLLVLVRFEAGSLVAEAIRFRQDVRGTTEYRARLFEIDFTNDDDLSAGGVVRFPGDTEGSFGSSTVGPLPDTVPGALKAAETFWYQDSVVPTWVASRLGFCIDVGGEQMLEGSASTGSSWGMSAVRWVQRRTRGKSAALRRDVGEGELPHWQMEPPLLGEPEQNTARMVMDLIEVARCLPLVLVRSPADCTPVGDGTGPQLMPGLYVGDYGHYGQFSSEVLLIEYKEVSKGEVNSLFARPFEGSGAPEELSQAITNLGDAEDDPLCFLIGTKVTGDLHVPAGQTSFVALCGPAKLRGTLDRSRGEAPQQVTNLRSQDSERVHDTWPGWGTLAMFGFRSPSWAPGWLIQLDGGLTGTTRFGFSWSRDQEIVVLEYVQAQQTSPFQNRRWLPEALR